MRVPKILSWVSKRTQFPPVAIRVILFFGVFLAAFNTQAATISAASPGFYDVSNAVSQATNGDMVVIPAGTADWTNTLYYGCGITLQGAGIGQTVIQDDILTDRGGGLNILATNLTYEYRITGISFERGTRDTEFYSSFVQVRGVSKLFRLDHCEFYCMRSESFMFETVCGVFDHNFCTVSNVNIIDGFGTYWGGAMAMATNFGYADESWAMPNMMGTSNFMFFEDNIFTNPMPGIREGVTDSYGGARWVFRYNSMSNTVIEAGHGTDSAGRIRSTRCVEVYENRALFYPQNGATWLSYRGGAGIVWSNTTSGFYNTTWAVLDVYRTDDPCSYGGVPGFGGVDGVNGWDLNDTNGGTGGLYFSGTATAGSSGCTVVVSGAGWTPNQWVGYSFRSTNQPSVSGGYTNLWQNAAISANTSDTLTLEQGTWITRNITNGVYFEIHRCIQPLDTIGAGGGDLLAASYAPTPVWLNQPMTPIYCWGNTESTGPITVAPGTALVVNGINYSNAVMPGYTPYTYPHPLTLIAQPPLVLPPSQLKASPPGQ